MEALFMGVLLISNNRNNSRSSSSNIITSQTNIIKAIKGSRIITRRSNSHASNSPLVSLDLQLFRRLPINNTLGQSDQQTSDEEEEEITATQALEHKKT